MVHWGFLKITLFKHTDGFCFIHLAFAYAPIANPALRSIRASFQAYYNLDFFFVPAASPPASHAAILRALAELKDKSPKSIFIVAYITHPCLIKIDIFYPPTAAYPWNLMPWLPAFDRMTETDQVANWVTFFVYILISGQEVHFLIL